MKAKVQSKIDDILGDTIPPVVVEEISDYVKLKNRDGLSSGQQLSTAYAFISAALEYSNVRLPFVVDSPVGSMDHVRRKGAGQVLPKATIQLIPFITPVEKGSFASHVQKAADYKCSYTTVFRCDELHNQWIKSKSIDQNDIEYFDDGECAVLYGEKWMTEYNFNEEAEREDI